MGLRPDGVPLPIAFLNILLLIGLACISYPIDYLYLKDSLCKFLLEDMAEAIVYAILSFKLNLLLLSGSWLVIEIGTDNLIDELCTGGPLTTIGGFILSLTKLWMVILLTGETSGLPWPS